MKKIILIAGLLMLSTAAFATEKPKEPDRVQPVSYDQDQDQGQAQHQGQHQGQAQQANAAAGAIAGAASNASNHTVVGVGVDSRNTNTNLVGVDTRDSNVNNNTDFNANNNTAHGGRGGEGGVGLGVGGNQAQQQGISDSGNSSSEASARGGDQEQSITASGNSANSNRNDSTAINEGNNAAQSTSVTFEAAKTYRNTPDAGAPSIYASGVCSGRSAGIGASGPGYGISLGGTGKNDAGCELRETARVLGGLGYVDTAFVLLCQQVPSVKEANGGHCQIPQEPEPPVVIYPEPEPEPEVPVIVDDIKG
jgi:hypothetical protein